MRSIYFVLCETNISPQNSVCACAKHTFEHSKYDLSRAELWQRSIEREQAQILAVAGRSATSGGIPRCHGSCQGFSRCFCCLLGKNYTVLSGVLWCFFFFFFFNDAKFPNYYYYYTFLCISCQSSCQESRSFVHI